jgi:hypothetical protein
MFKNFKIIFFQTFSNLKMFYNLSVKVYRKTGIRQIEETRKNI